VLKNVSQTQVLRNPLVPRQPLQAEAIRELPDIPVMPETLLLLEFMVQEQIVDLREMSQVVLSDVGATLQIFRLLAREHGDNEGHPARIEDCISDLGLEACLRAVSALSVSRDVREPAIAAFWAHSREIAQYSKQVAEEMTEVNPDEAYLAGLLHAIGLLPGLLEWREASVADGALAGLRLARRWSLPGYVTELFQEMQLTGYATRWSGIVRKAHQRAARSSVHCSFEQDLRPRLHANGHGEPGPLNFL
jgi:hypothetical protein